ncbi:MAG TPA: MBL fold metallo-hydrolase [Terriglobales bacterium]|jgi:glyoxylase-like metal-dependent hydrolase (beta-lactamase superfamily II)|nr:MBL fold metallo-hydrolase [Terriglobales bacterium]
MRRLMWVGILLMLLAGVAAAQQKRDFSKVEIKVTKVTDAVYMLQGSGGNITALVGPDGVVMVDTEFAELAPKIEAALRGVTDKPLRFIINTHWHFDHTDGNAAWSAKAPILSNDKLRARMVSGGKVLGMDFKPAPPEALPAITYPDRMALHLNGEDIEIVHYPAAHTDGDSVVFFPKEHVAATGDEYFANIFPFIDLDSGGSVRGYIDAVDKQIAMYPEDVKIIPGHGPLSTLADFRAYASMLRDCEGIVEDGMRHGKTADQMKQEKVLAKYHKWASSFIDEDKFIDTLYKSLSAEKK